MNFQRSLLKNIAIPVRPYLNVRQRLPFRTCTQYVVIPGNNSRVVLAAFRRRSWWGPARKEENQADPVVVRSVQDRKKSSKTTPSNTGKVSGYRCVLCNSSPRVEVKQAVAEGKGDGVKKRTGNAVLQTQTTKLKPNYRLTVAPHPVIATMVAHFCLACNIFLTVTHLVPIFGIPRSTGRKRTGVYSISYHPPQQANLYQHLTEGVPRKQTTLKCVQFLPKEGV